jgi:hypothetical protein
LQKRKLRHGLLAWAACWGDWLHAAAPALGHWAECLAPALSLSFFPAK